MQHKTLAVIFIVLFGGCSHPPAINTWQYNATSSVQAYQEHFLQNHLLRAKSDLSRARSFASQSADLHTRIDIELTVCAMQLGILKATSCENASVLLQIEPDPFQLAYLHLLTAELNKKEINRLPEQYRAFASAMLEEDPAQINTQVKQIRPLSSRLVASALAQKHLTKKTIDLLITELSYHGYKNPLLAWLHVQMQNEADPHKKARLKAKISVLTSG
jgi:hypothetical protein